MFNKVLLSFLHVHNDCILAPHNAIVVCTHILTKSYSKVVDYIHNELRAAFELTYLFENYALSLQGIY